MCLENPVGLPQASVPHFNHPVEAAHDDTVARPIKCQPSNQTVNGEPVVAHFALRRDIPQMEAAVRETVVPNASGQPTAVTREFQTENPVGPTMEQIKLLRIICFPTLQGSVGTGRINLPASPR
jgi:hypothetical protein